MSQPSSKTWNSVEQKLHHKGGRVPGHGKEKGSGQKVKEDRGKRYLKLSETGSLVKVGSG